MTKLYAGTSGFAYPSWKPEFYPADVPAKRFLQHYATRLTSTEINYTFRRLPSAKSLGEWAEATPPEFLFSMKAHQKLTHFLRLNECDSFLEIFLRAIDPLRVAGRLGPVLFQLPPSLKCDLGLLENFLGLLPADGRWSFEFRHDSWLGSRVYDTLGRHGACLCVAESEKLTVPEVLTAAFVYLRLRQGLYTPEERLDHRNRVRHLLEQRDVFLYYKHEESALGALYAEELLRGLASSSP